ncbi:MAG: precorrin-3B C(17)-methyltransferase, partial [Bacteroidia bacterium]
AAQGDFITAIYNPKSKERYWQLYRLQEIFLQYRSPETPVGVVRQAGREEETKQLTTLADFNPETIDMFSLIIIGNSQSFTADNMMISPRGYYRQKDNDGNYIGQDIMIESFRTIASELRNPDLPLDKKWALIHCIHTTADFDMENIFYADDHAIENLHKAFENKTVDTIITDVNMVASGIRKGAIARLGLEVKCYLNDPRTAELAKAKGLTRTQAGIRLAAKEHPNALYAFGNAPTALIELCDLMRKDDLQPAGVIAAPVGFVNVRESKYMVKTFRKVPKVIIEGRKGGSNIAATITNAILSLDGAHKMRPGNDM